MGIQITHNDDGSITAECGDEQLTFFPKRPAQGRAGGGPQTIAGPWIPPIPSGGRHRATVYVPVGDEPGMFELGGFAPIVEFGANQKIFESNLTRVMSSGAIAGDAPISVRVLANAGTKLDIGRVLSVADAVTHSPMALYLTTKLSGK